MSGGSYDYIGFKIADIDLRNKTTDPRRAAFQKLLKLVGNAMHEIEWVDSCDSSPGAEYAAIDLCFEFLKANPDTIKKAQAYDALKEMVGKFLETPNGDSVKDGEG